MTMPFGTVVSTASALLQRACRKYSKDYVAKVRIEKSETRAV